MRPTVTALARSFSPALLIFLVAAPLWGGGSTGALVGTISDPSRAVVAGARVRARNLGTMQTRDVETNEIGNYAIPLLPPGLYEVSVEQTGFRSTVQTQHHGSCESGCPCGRDSTGWGGY